MRTPSSSASTSKTKTPCCSKVGIKRGPWTPEEDEVLANYIKREGEGRWRTLPKRAGLLRCGKSCRLRWMNYLRPCVKRGRIAPDEEDLILRLHRLLGNRWSLIAGRIPGRTDNEIKNYWNTHLSKKLINQGIDPRTHKPLNLNPNPNPSQIGHHEANHPKQNSNPNSLELHEPSGSLQLPVVPSRNGENYPMINTDQFHNQIVDRGRENQLDCDGFMMGYLPTGHGRHDSGEDYIGNSDEDAFDTFLDSLINDNVFVNQQQQQPNMIATSSVYPFVSSVETFNHGTIWEAEAVSTMAAALGGEKLRTE